MLFISLTTCNIEFIIPKVLDNLFNYTKTPFYLSIVDNDSKDSTISVIKSHLSSLVSSYCEGIKLVTIPSRVNAVDAINLSFSPIFKDWSSVVFTHVIKLDHDYGVPENWDVTLIKAFELRKDLHLLCPSVHPSTPKGMQYYSQNHQPEEISKVDDLVFYHYTGIAGYAHSWRYEDFKQLVLPNNKVYNQLHYGAVFGSEDAAMSLRCKQLWPGNTNAYIFNLEGFHWDKKIEKEDEWKSLATFKKTHLHYEDWLVSNCRILPDTTG